MKMKKLRGCRGIYSVLLCALAFGIFLSSCQRNPDSVVTDGTTVVAGTTQTTGMQESTVPSESEKGSNEVVPDGFDHYILIDLDTPGRESGTLLEAFLLDDEIYTLCEVWENDSLVRYISVFDRAGEYVRSVVPPDSDLAFFSVQVLQDGSLLFVYHELSYAEVGLDDFGISCLFSLVNMDGNGKILSISKELSLSFPNLVPYLAVDAENRVFIATEGKVFVVDLDGNILKEISDDNFIGNMYRMSDGFIYGYCMELIPTESDTQFLRRIDVEEQIMRKDSAISLSDTMNPYMLSVVDGCLYSSGTSGVMTYDLSSRQFAEVLDWGRSGQKMADNGFFRILAKDVILAYYSSSDREKIALIKSIPVENAPGVITIGAVNTMGIQDVTLMIERLNERDEGAVYVFKDYSELAETKNDADYDGDRFEAAIRRLNMDILSGEGPDILMDSESLPLDGYERQGLFLDVSGLLEPEMYGADKYYEEVLFSGRNADGAVFRVPVSFSVAGMSVPRHVAPENTSGWTFEEFDEWCKEVGSEGNPAYISQEESLHYIIGNLVRLDSSPFIDRQNGKVDFRNQAFRDILAFAEKYPILSRDVDYEKAVARDMYYSSLSGYCTTVPSPPNTLVSLLGYPSENRNAPTVSLNYTLSILRGCSDAELAWKVIEFMLSEELQSELLLQESSCIPVNRTALERHIEKTLNGDSEMLENVYRNYWYYRDGEIILPTEDEARAFLEIVESAKYYPTIPNQVSYIIVEEVQPYFAGQKSAEMVAEIIGSRVRTWLNEQG